jgi:DNA-binding transcriptional LysR family regulator
MELKYLNTVKTILETDSYQNAARKLNYTQSTVTFQIQQLEQELNVKLFEKIGRKMVLTQAGKDIMPYVNSVLETIEQISNYGKKYNELSGSLKIAFPESLLIYKIQGALMAFRKAAPNVEIAIQVLNCYEINDFIAKGIVDIGVHYNIEPNPSITTETLNSFAFVLVGAPELAKDERDFIQPNQRKNIADIHADSDSVYSDIFNKYLKEKNIQLSGNIAIQSLEAIKLSVASNLGVAYLPLFTVEKELKERTLIEIETSISNPQIFSMVSYHKNKWISPAMELFIRQIKEQFANV